MNLNMKNCIEIAIKNIASFGDTDIFPFPFENHIFRDRPDIVQQAIEGLHRNFRADLETNPPENINTLAPVGSMGFRWATQIDPLWNAYYLALVVKLGTAIESARIPSSEKTVFSYRFITPSEDKGEIFDKDVNWQAYLRTCAEEAENFPYVIVCDISEFYSRIYHHRIENALKWLKESPEVVRNLMDLLQVFSGSVSYGLPVGGPASRLLAELALNSTDKLLRSDGVRFCRFVDDYRIFCTTKEEAYQRLIFLSEKLFNEGLSLQKSKTRILTAKELKDETALFLRSSQVSEENLSEEQKLLRLSIRFDPYSQTRVDDYEELKDQVAKVDVAGILARELEKTQIDAVVVKQALSALRVIDSASLKGILLSLLQAENLQSLAPVFPRLMTVLASLYSDLEDEIRDVVDGSLIDLVNSRSHVIKVDLHLAYLVRVLAIRNSPIKESLFVRIFKESSSPLVRRSIILAMAAWGHNYWVTDLKKRFSVLSKWERRSFLIASYYLTDEGSHWRGFVSFDRSELVVRDWFSDRFQKNQTVPQ
jgi:hypothetical protein